MDTEEKAIKMRKLLNGSSGMSENLALEMVHVDRRICRLTEQLRNSSILMAFETDLI